MPAMSGAYDHVRSSVTTSTAITTNQVTIVAGTMVEVVRMWANQSTITTSAQTRSQFLRKSAVATVTSQGPIAKGNGMQASKCVGGTSATGITASAEGTDGVVFVEEGYNIVNGWLYLPVPEERIYMITTSYGHKFPTAPTSAGWVVGSSFLEYAS